MTGITTVSAGTQAAASVRVALNIRVIMVAAASSMVLGMGGGGLGTTLHDLSLNTGSPTETLGILFTMIFMASLFSQLIAGMVNDRFGTRPIVLMGTLTYGTGLILCSFAPSLLTLCLIGLVMGSGLGMLGIGRILLITETFPAQRVRFTSLTSVFYSIGAVIGPLTGGLSLRLFGSALPLLWLAGAGALMIFSTILIQRDLNTPIPVRAIPPEIPPSAPAGRFTALAIYRSPILWLSGSALLIYGGLENGMGSWTPIYAERSVTLPAENAALVVSAFFLMLMVGRLINVAIGTRYAPRRILLTACTGALTGTLLMLLGHGNLPLTLAAVMLMGLSFGPIFPTTFALVTGTFRNAPGKTGGLVAAMGSLGVSLLVPVQGFILERGGTAANPVYLLAAVATMFILFGIMLRVMIRAQNK